MPSYCSIDDVRRRVPVVKISPVSKVPQASVEAWIAEQSARIDQVILQGGWHALPLDLEAEGAESAAAILQACAAAGATALLLSAIHDQAGMPSDRISPSDPWAKERDRLMVFCGRRLPGLPTRDCLGATL